MKNLIIIAAATVAFASGAASAADTMAKDGMQKENRAMAMDHKADEKAKAADKKMMKNDTKRHMADKIYHGS
jgi:Ni/Co efflux regulator RcnB